MAPSTTAEALPSRGAMVAGVMRPEPSLMGSTWALSPWPPLSPAPGLSSVLIYPMAPPHPTPGYSQSPYMVYEASCDLACLGRLAPCHCS